MRTAILLAAIFAGSCAAQTAQSPAQAPPSPAEAAQRIYDQCMRDPYWKMEYTGEDFAWHAAVGMSGFLSGYQSIGDTVFLDWGVKYFDAMIARMAEGPDGYKGWIGPYEYDKRFFCDDHVGDAILFDGILDFAYAVSRDPKLTARYGDKVREYVQIAKHDVLEKWDARGTWHEDGPYGEYASWDKFGMPGQYKDWSVKPECAPSSNLTLPFNKQIDVGVVALRLWQITGDVKYKQRAEKLFGFMKSRMQRYKDEYHWNYFEPGGQWDLAEGKRPNIRHWVGVHPERNYQSGEIVNIMKAYNAGIVFTKEDIQGILNTNLKLMWNQDKEKPLYANSNADLKGPVGPAAFAGRHAGDLWTALAQVDGTVREIMASRMRSGSRPGSFRNANSQPAPSFDRRDAPGKVEIPQVYAQYPLGNVRTIQMGAVLPSIFPRGQKAMIACKLIETGDLEIALYSPDGRKKIATLHQGKEAGGADGLEGIFYFPFDGTDPATHKAFAPGNYRVRWTVAGDGYREFPITIQRAR